MTTFQKMQPIFIAGAVVGASAMPEPILAVCALVLVGISGWMCLSNRKRGDGS
ncbi:MAG TPA: hypothetical protein VKY62_10545 [Devosia sp.]|nr:hypothetical protein [Devosia sp.]